MSIFSISSSRKTSNQVKIKYQEDIVSNNDIIKNSSSLPSHNSIEFLNFFGSVMGLIKDKLYYPIFSTGSIPDSGKFFRLLIKAHQYVTDIFQFNSQTSLDPPLTLNFDSIDAHLEQARQVDTLLAQQILSQMTAQEALDIYYEVIFDIDMDIDEETRELLSYKNWGYGEPTPS